MTTPRSESNSQTQFKKDGTYRVLCLDGGGAKGFYTLGVLKEVESVVGPLHECFDLIYGTSTGSIIAAMLGLGMNVDSIHAHYKTHVPAVMSKWFARSRSSALKALAEDIFKELEFDAFKTDIGIVSTKWEHEKPMIFKTNIAQAHGRKDTFKPGFGVKIADAVQASCSAFPFFLKTTIQTSAGDNFKLIDGGFCANNPTLYALADALVSVGKQRADVRVLSVGVGNYPPPKSIKMWIVKKLGPGVELLQKTLEVNTQSMDQLRAVLYKDVQTVRISDTFAQPEMATDLMEHNRKKLNLLRQRGAESFGAREHLVRELLLSASAISV